MSESEKRKRGRPKERGSMHNQYRLRMSDDMTARLDNLCQMMSKSRADIFREAFNIYENLQKSKLPDRDFEDEFDEFDDEDEDDF